jgi:hypothetical protein
MPCAVPPLFSVPDSGLTVEWEVLCPMLWGLMPCGPAPWANADSLPNTQINSASTMAQIGAFIVSFGIVEGWLRHPIRYTGQGYDRQILSVNPCATMTVVADGHTCATERTWPPIRAPVGDP